MKTKNAISTQLASYEKSYEETNDFETFRTSIYNIIQAIETITPISPVNSSYLFQTKLDCENLDRNSAPNLLASLKNFLERLD